MTHLSLSSYLLFHLLLASSLLGNLGEAQDDLLGTKETPWIPPAMLSATNAMANTTTPETNHSLCSKCSGRSLCIVTPSGNTSCFCPPDYTGQYCDQKKLQLPSLCQYGQCENGAICEQGRNESFCVCPRNYVGTNCSRVALWVKVEMNLYKDGSLVRWEDQKKSDPEISDAACNKLIYSTLNGSNPVIATSLVDCLLHSYEKVRVGNEDGVRVEALLKFDPGNNASAFHGIAVRKHIESASENTEDVGIDFEVDETISVSNFDVCTGQFHDCAPSAMCVLDGLSYSCQCNRFYTDRGMPGILLPGRDCYYSFMSGFFVGCLIILPILVVAFVGLFYCRRYQAQKAWIAATGESDAVQLVSAQQLPPKYSA